ncbi:MAG: phospholipid carrier-dependent glycosyltransferase [Ignavibacteriales bacterium]|nr:MAG: phospholipid carrier-dependent glycosyltransferase [Ignavibacteriales bacterium]
MDAKKIIPFLNENKTAVIVAVISIVIHFCVNLFTAYGIFRDELYYLACGNNLDWGYVDQPFLSIILLKINSIVFGESLFAIRLLPALCHAALIFITCLLVKELGGNKFAVMLAGITILFVPVFEGIFNFYSMNSWDILFWTSILYVFVRIIKTENQRLWILLGILIGLGLQNKYSVMFLCIGLFIGILFTPMRKIYLQKWVWMSAAIAFIIFLPHIIWQIANHFPTLEFINNAKLHKNAPINPIDFLKEQFMNLNPINAIVWLPGLFFFLFSKSIKQFRIFGFAYIIIFLFLAVQNSKPYYLTPVYPILFAGGAVLIGNFIANKNLNWLKPVFVISVIFGGIVSMPMAMPVLAPETFVKYTQSLGITLGGEEMDRNQNKLGQHYADMFGWKEMADSVAKVYWSLPKEERMKCAIFGQNYGQAGAIDYFGKKYGLPPAICAHNSYWFWGPKSWDGQIVIVIGGDEEDYKEYFKEYCQAGIIDHPYSRPFERHLPIYVVKGLKKPVSEIWPQLRFFI